MKLLIDTHAFLWLASDISKLSPKAQHLFSDDANEIYLSVASLWEMAIKIGLGKLQVAKPLATLVAEQQQAIPQSLIDDNLLPVSMPVNLYHLWQCSV